MAMYARKLLTDEEVKTIFLLMQGAEWERSATVGNVYLDAQQKNSEMAESDKKREIYNIVMSAIGRDEGFRDLVFPERSTYIIVSRTEEGQGFKVHHDSPNNGDFSTTVFLSDPNTYGGGELTMYIGGETRPFALPAGWALTYETGIPHCVNEVGGGVRYAIVFWTTSLIKDSRWRDILTDLRKAKKLLPRDYGYDLTKTETDPHFIIQGVENKILRHFINT